jgi:ribosomal protein S18 acetylase RimI-like enzyme
VELIWEPITDPITWAELCARAEAVDATGESYTLDELAEELADPADDPRLRTGVWSDGVLVGYGGIRVRGEAPPNVRIDMEGTVAPDHRGLGIGSQLIDWCLRLAAAERDARLPGSPIDVSATGHPDNPVQFQLLAGRGFRTRTWEALMTCRIAAVQPAPLPRLGGFRVAVYDPDRRYDVRVAHNQAFGTDPGYAPWSAEEWRHWVDETMAARPALSLVAYDETTDQVASYVIAQEYDGVREATGVRELYISKVGTVPTYRGRGLARALLVGVVGLAKTEGYDQIALHADANSPTGAFTLYESAGFTVHRQQERMYLAIPPS